MRSIYLNHRHCKFQAPVLAPQFKMCCRARIYFVNVTEVNVLCRPNGGRSCVCPVGYELQTDNATCVMPAAFLVYTQSPVMSTANSIMRISLDTSPANNHRINIANMTSAPISIDIDEVQSTFAWSLPYLDYSKGLDSNFYCSGCLFILWQIQIHVLEYQPYFCFLLL